MIDIWLRNRVAHLSTQAKISFIAAFSIGLLVHSFIFLNHYHTHDSFSNLYDVQNKEGSGRFFLQYTSMWSSYFELPWVNGLFSLFYLSIMAMLIVLIFEIQKNSSAILIGGIVVAFPTVTSTFAYMFTADGYMLGMLIAILAIFVTKKWRYGWLLGAIFTYISVGVYQANLTIILAFIGIFMLQQLLIKVVDMKTLAVMSTKLFGMFGIGMLLYLIHYKWYQSIGMIVSYQGLDTAGLPSLSEMWALRHTIYNEVMTFFFEGLYTVGTLRVWDFLHIVLFILLAMFSSYYVIQKQLYKEVPRLVVAVSVIVLMPVFYYAVYFTSSEVEYHMLMVYAIVTFYILAICFFDDVDMEQKIPLKVGASATWLAIIAVIINFGIVANISYFNMHIKYEKSLALADRVLTRIEALEDYKEINNIAVIGYPKLYSPLTSKTIPEAIPSITGSAGESFLQSSYHYQKLFEVYYGVGIMAAPAQKIEEIQKTTQFKEMGVWPATSSVQIIDGTVVVKYREI